MEICTIANLVALAETVSGLTIEMHDADLSEASFTEIVEDLFGRINQFSRWNEQGNRFNLTICYFTSPS